MKRWTEKLKQCILCFQTQLADPNLVAICVRYYRLVSRWLVVTANPPPEGLPLSDKVPRLFAALPEFVMNDVAEFLKSVTHLAPQVQERSEQTLTTPRHAHRLRKSESSVPATARPLYPRSEAQARPHAPHRPPLLLLTRFIP